MAIRKIRELGAFGDSVLKKPCKEVGEITPRIRDLIDDMFETLYEAEGVGLAAPQVGVPLRVVVIDVGEGYFELVNPVIISTKGEQTGAEGCLSVKGKQGTVTRPNKVKAEYRDRNGKKHKLTADGFFSLSVCHELDHLDGILYTDKASEVYDLPPEDI